MLKLVQVALIASFVYSKEIITFSTLSDIPLDDSGLLQDQWIVYPDEGKCASVIEKEWFKSKRKNTLFYYSFKCKTINLSFHVPIFLQLM